MTDVRGQMTDDEMTPIGDADMTAMELLQAVAAVAKVDLIFWQGRWWVRSDDVLPAATMSEARAWRRFIMVLRERLVADRVAAAIRSMIPDA